MTSPPSLQASSVLPSSVPSSDDLVHCSMQPLGKRLTPLSCSGDRRLRRMKV